MTINYNAGVKICFDHLIAVLLEKQLEQLETIENLQGVKEVLESKLNLLYVKKFKRKIDCELDRDVQIELNRRIRSVSFLNQSQQITDSNSLYDIIGTEYESSNLHPYADDLITTTSSTPLDHVVGKMVSNLLSTSMQNSFVAYEQIVDRLNTQNNTLHTLVETDTIKTVKPENADISFDTLKKNITQKILKRFKNQIETELKHELQKNMRDHLHKPLVEKYSLFIKHFHDFMVNDLFSIIYINKKHVYLSNCNKLLRLSDAVIQLQYFNSKIEKEVIKIDTHR